MFQDFRYSYSAQMISYAESIKNKNIISLLAISNISLIINLKTIIGPLISLLSSVLNAFIAKEHIIIYHP